MSFSGVLTWYQADWVFSTLPWVDEVPKWEIVEELLIDWLLYFIIALSPLLQSWNSYNFSLMNGPSCGKRTNISFLISNAYDWGNWSFRGNILTNSHACYHGAHTIALCELLQDYSEMSQAYRPSHADATYDFKYGVRSVQVPSYYT